MVISRFVSTRNFISAVVPAQLVLFFILLIGSWSHAANYPTMVGGSYSQDPYGWTGLISSSDYRGSGAVVKHPKVVLSCAHLVYDESSFMYSDDNYWFWRLNSNVAPSNSSGVVLRGFYYFSGYASAAHGSDSSKAFAADFVCHYSYVNLAGGGYGGFWNDGQVAMESSASKIVSGYPARENDIQSNPYKYTMYATGPTSNSFKAVDYIEYMEAVGLSCWKGMSGGPVWVRNSNGKFAFAGVCVSGRSFPVTLGARVVDANAWSLVDLAIESSKTWKNTKVGTVANVAPGERNAVYNPAWNHVYYKGTDNNIWVNFNVGGGWVTQKLSSVGNVLGSLAFNQAWNHIYYRGSDGYVWTCFIQNNQWKIQRIGTVGNVQGEMVFNSNWSQVYYRGTDGNPWVSYFDQSVWKNTKLANVTSGFSTVFNPNWNHVYQSQADSTIGTLFFDSQWKLINLSGSANLSASAGLDTQRITVNTNWNQIYYQGDDNNIWACFLNKGAWVTQPLRSGFGSGYVSGAVAFNSRTNSIFYKGYDNGLWTCELNGGSWGNRVVGTSTNVSANSPLIYGSAWNHFYYRGTDGALWALFYD